jgi:integrase
MKNNKSSIIKSESATINPKTGRRSTITEPIRDPKVLNNIKNHLQVRSLKYFSIFVLGINSGLRISDILRLQVGDLLEKTKEGWKIKSSERINTKKTGVYLTIFTNQAISDALVKYISTDRPKAKLTEYLFPPENNPNKPMHRSSVNDYFEKVAAAVGVKQLACHTMRKTFALMHYKNGMNLATLAEILGHNSEAMTRRYLGITYQQIEQSIKQLNI